MKLPFFEVSRQMEQQALEILELALEKISASHAAKKAVKLREQMRRNRESDDGGNAAQNFSKNDTVNDTVNRRILLQLRRYPEISAEEISEKITVSIATVKRRIARLKELGILKREGSDKTGRWIVNEKLINNMKGKSK